MIKRSLSPGFAGIDNPLFYLDNTMMLFADGKDAVEIVVSALADVWLEFARSSSGAIVRNYTDEPVDPAALERILDTARRAPSAGFSQGQAFVVITQPQRRTASQSSPTNPPTWPGVRSVDLTCPGPYRGGRERRALPSPVPGGRTRRRRRGAEWPVPYWWVDAVPP